MRVGIRQRPFYTREISSPNPRHRSRHPLLLPAPAGPRLPPSSPCCRVCSPAPPSSRGLPRGRRRQQRKRLWQRSFVPVLRSNPPQKRQQAGGAGRGEAASPPGAAGKASAGSTRSLTAETRTVQGGEKTKPSRCSSPSPTPTQATAGFEPSSLGKRGGKMKGSQAPGLSYPTGSYHPQWLLTTAVPF